jgi:hypothetical protein
VICTVCEHLVDLPEEAHHPHAKACTGDGCRCDFPCHPWCCWDTACRELYAAPLSRWQRVGLGALLAVLLVSTVWLVVSAVTLERAEGQECRDGVCVSGCDDVGGDPCQWVRYEPAVPVEAEPGVVG